MMLGASFGELQDGCVAAPWRPGAGAELFLMQGSMYECCWDPITAPLLHVSTNVRFLFHCEFMGIRSLYQNWSQCVKG